MMIESQLLLWWMTALAALLTGLVAALLFQYRRFTSAPPHAYLYRREGRHVVRHGIRRSLIRIGRHPDNDVRLGARSVSRFHAEIVENPNGSFLIRDMDSKNGIRIYQRRVNASVLADGDLVFLGKVGVRFIHYPPDFKQLGDTEELESDARGVTPKRRRRTERFRSGARVHYYADGVGWMTGIARDLSEEGLFIETDRGLPRRTPIDMVVKRGQGGRWSKLKGEVVRSDNAGIAVVLTDVDRSTKSGLIQATRAEAIPFTGRRGVSAVKRS